MIIMYNSLLTTKRSYHRNNLCRCSCGPFLKYVGLLCTHIYNKFPVDILKIDLTNLTLQKLKYPNMYYSINIHIYIYTYIHIRRCPIREA